MPVGTYVWIIRGLPEFVKSSKKQTDGAKFQLECLEALDDVDQEDLAKVGGAVGKIKEHTFWITEKSAFMLTEFLTDCGIPMEDDAGNELSDRQRLEYAPGKSFLGAVKHTPSADGKGINWEIGRTAPLES